MGDGLQCCAVAQAQQAGKHSPRRGSPGVGLGGRAASLAKTCLSEWVEAQCLL